MVGLSKDGTCLFVSRHLIDSKPHVLSNAYIKDAGTQNHTCVTIAFTMHPEHTMLVHSLGEDVYDWHRLPLWSIKYKGRGQGSEPETLGAQ